VFAKNFAPPFIIFPFLHLGLPSPPDLFYFFHFSYEPFPLAFSELWMLLPACYLQLGARVSRKKHARENRMAEKTLNEKSKLENYKPKHQRMALNQRPNTSASFLWCDSRCQTPDRVNSGSSAIWPECLPGKHSQVSELKFHITHTARWPRQSWGTFAFCRGCRQSN